MHDSVEFGLSREELAMKEYSTSCLAVEKDKLPVLGAAEFLRNFFYLTHFLLHE